MIASQQISDQRSELAASQRRVELARTTFERERQLWQDKISAEQDYLLARQTLQEAEIALNNARQKMTALSGSAVLAGGNRYELRAPFAGVVVENTWAWARWSVKPATRSRSRTCLKCGSPSVSFPRT